MANIEKKQNSFVAQATSIDGMLEQWKTYEKLKTKLRGEGDFIQFKTKNNKLLETPTKKWRVKLERFFGISLQIKNIQERPLSDGEVLYIVTALATHPSGAYHEATGACSTAEKKEVVRKIYNEHIKKYEIVTVPNLRKYHDAISHAETRAKNRAVFEFVGMGEVSAEEISANEDYHSTSKGHYKNPPNTPVEKSKPISEKQKAYIERLLKERVHKDIEKAQKIIGADLTKIDKNKASELIEKLQELVTIEKRKDLMILSKELKWTKEDLTQFLKDNEVNPYLISEKKFDELSEILISFSKSTEDEKAEEI